MGAFTIKYAFFSPPMVAVHCILMVNLPMFSSYRDGGYTYFACGCIGGMGGGIVGCVVCGGGLWEVCVALQNFFPFRYTKSYVFFAYLEL
jgi:hypothetical protein